MEQGILILCFTIELVDRPQFLLLHTIDSLKKERARQDYPGGRPSSCFLNNLLLFYF